MPTLNPESYVKIFLMLVFEELGSAIRFHFDERETSGPTVTCAYQSWETERTTEEGLRAVVPAFCNKLRALGWEDLISNPLMLPEAVQIAASAIHNGLCIRHVRQYNIAQNGVIDRFDCSVRKPRQLGLASLPKVLLRSRFELLKNG